MINYHPVLKTELEKILPVYYELWLHAGLTTPCISYMELDNRVIADGDTVAYSSVTFQVKVWDTDVPTVRHYAQEVDKALRPLGFRRMGCTELSDGTMIQYVMRFEAIGRETF